MNKAIFLDRDGIINQAIVKNGKPFPPADLSEFKINDDVYFILDGLKKLGYYLIIITNQPDVKRGKTSISVIKKINSIIKKKLPIDDIKVCYHDNEDMCECRKPKPGLILASKKKYNLDLGHCYVVGDRWRDIDAGVNAGCKTIFINYNYDEQLPNNYDYKFNSLLEAFVNLFLLREKL